ncbi:MAG: hypothetical protein AB7V77_04180 [Candidatus Woesearchaeota archaeon]
MVKKEKPIKSENNYFMISIIAIVAIVAIVAMTIYFAKPNAMTNTAVDYTTSESQDLAGQAIKSIGVKPLPDPIPITFTETIGSVVMKNGNGSTMNIDANFISGSDACEDNGGNCVGITAETYLDDGSKHIADAIIPSSVPFLDGEEVSYYYFKYLPYQKDFFLVEGESVSYWNDYNVKLERVGENAILVSLSKDHQTQQKVISDGDGATFDEFNDFTIKVDSLFYIAGATDNGAKIFMYFQDTLTKFEAKCSKVERVSLTK